MMITDKLSHDNRRTTAEHPIWCSRQSTYKMLKISWKGCNLTPPLLTVATPLRVWSFHFLPIDLNVFFSRVEHIGVGKPPLEIGGRVFVGEPRGRETQSDQTGPGIANKFADLSHGHHATTGVFEKIQRKSSVNNGVRCGKNIIIQCLSGSHKLYHRIFINGVVYIFVRNVYLGRAENLCAYDFAYV